MEPFPAKVLITDLFGPDLRSITYRAGQVIGGTAFSEDDIFSKFYRDSSVFSHYIRENARLNGKIGAQLAEACAGWNARFRRSVRSRPRSSGPTSSRSGSFLLEPLRLEETRYVHELMWADGTLRVAL